MDASLENEGQPGAGNNGAVKGHYEEMKELREERDLLLKLLALKYEENKRLKEDCSKYRNALITSEKELDILREYKKRTCKLDVEHEEKLDIIDLGGANSSLGRIEQSVNVNEATKAGKSSSAVGLLANVEMNDDDDTSNNASEVKEFQQGKADSNFQCSRKCTNQQGSGSSEEADDSDKNVNEYFKPLMVTRAHGSTQAGHLFGEKSTATPSDYQNLIATVCMSSIKTAENIQTNHESLKTVNPIIETTDKNPYDKVVNPNVISNDDLMANFCVMIKSKMPKHVLNRLRRRRSKLRQKQINQDRQSRGLPLIQFRDRARIYK